MFPCMCLDVAPLHSLPGGWKCWHYHIFIAVFIAPTETYITCRLCFRGQICSSTCFKQLLGPSWTTRGWCISWDVSKHHLEIWNFISVTFWNSSWKMTARGVLLGSFVIYGHIEWITLQLLSEFINGYLETVESISKNMCLHRKATFKSEIIYKNSWEDTFKSYKKLKSPIQNVWAKKQEAISAHRGQNNYRRHLPSGHEENQTTDLGVHRRLLYEPRLKLKLMDIVSL